MSIKYYYELEQGTDEWHEARLGTVTASQVNRIVTPKGKKSSGKAVKAFACELASQRVNKRIEETFQSSDCQRGHFQEVLARDIYAENYEDTVECGFITRQFEGFKIGGSPDGLCGEDGGIEIKSRLAKFQVQTIVENEVPDDYINQCQTFLIITGREWIDFVQYSSGMPLFVKRVYPDIERQTTILEAISELEPMIEEMKAIFEVKAGQMVQTEYVEFSLDDDLIIESEGE